VPPFSTVCSTRQPQGFLESFAGFPPWLAPRFPALNPRDETLLSNDPVALPRRLRPLVAVLPFTPTGDDAALHLLGGDVADLLREHLANDPAVQAILISSDFLAKAPPHAVELICRELRIGFLVSGKCHGNAEHPSLYVELTDTRDWHVRWAHFYRGNARSLLATDGGQMAELVAALRQALIEQRHR
jgi:TolB-like protein